MADHLSKEMSRVTLFDIILTDLQHGIATNVRRPLFDKSCAFLDGPSFGNAGFESDLFNNFGCFQLPSTVEVNGCDSIFDVPLLQ